MNEHIESNSLFAVCCVVGLMHVVHTFPSWSKQINICFLSTSSTLNYLIKRELTFGLGKVCS